MSAWKRTFADRLGIPLAIADATDLFLERLAEVIDPELKRRIIGHAFIEVFETEAKRSAARVFSGRARSIPT